MSGRAVKCQGCSGKFVREEGNYEKSGKGYFHKSCYQKMIASRAAREDLSRYCMTIFGENANFGLIGKQIKDYTTKYKYTESGIKGTLYYLTEVKKMKLNPRMGIAIVPYHYEKARLYFERVDSVSDLPSFNSIVEETSQVVIEKPVNKKRYSRVVNLDDMFKEGEI